jgi:hypothetical protein
VDNFYDPSLPNSIARQTGAAVVVLPNQVEGEPDVASYFALIDRLIAKITEALKSEPVVFREALRSRYDG